MAAALTRSLNLQVLCCHNALNQSIRSCELAEHIMKKTSRQSDSRRMSICTDSLIWQNSTHRRRQFFFQTALDNCYSKKTYERISYIRIRLAFAQPPQIDLTICSIDAKNPDIKPGLAESDVFRTEASTDIRRRRANWASSLVQFEDDIIMLYP